MTRKCFESILQRHVDTSGLEAHAEPSTAILEIEFMIGYVTLGTNDMQRAAAFYDALLGELGAKRTWDTERFILWSVRPDLPGIAVILPFDGQPATHGNGTMISIAAGSTAKVDAVYKKAMELGAKDEGPAGPRNNNFYAGYFRDPDGNKLCAFCMTSA